MRSYPEQLPIDYLKHKHVISAKINEDNDCVILETTEHTIYLTWTGDCCAQCFIANMSGSENLINADILDIQHSEWKTLKDDDCEVINSMGTDLRTNKGYVTFETRLQHNGYYSGKIVISKEGPIGQYGDLAPDMTKHMKPLTDF